MAAILSIYLFSHSTLRETLINSTNEMKHEAHGTQQPRHISKIGEGASTAQRSDSLVQSINQRFLSLSSVLLGLTLISIISYSFSRPIQGLGIGMPILVAPVSAAMAGLLINPEQSAALAYISGTLDVLIGADLLRMKDISQLGTPYVSIGGAGTFDGIFITGIAGLKITQNKNGLD